MAEVDVARFTLQRVNPFQGLMIDSATWRDAHEYHRNQMRLHQLALHGWGIAQGLDVSLDESAEDTLLVGPGIAVDASGSFIVVTEPYRHHVAAREAGTVYLLLLFSEVPAGPLQPTGVNGSGQPTRILEAYRIQQRDRLPDEPFLELARVRYDPGAGPLRRPPEGGRPGVNELDLGHRPSLGQQPVVLPAVDAGAPAPSPLAAKTAAPQPVPPPVLPPEAQPAAPPPTPPPAPELVPPLVLALGLHGAGGAGEHQDGLRYLARELQQDSGREMQVRQAGPLAGLEGVDFLYLCGHGRLALDGAEVEAIRMVLDGGGVVMGEGCAEGPAGDAGAREFALSFAELADRLGRQLARVERGDALLVARHVFSGPPAGARASVMVLERDGMVYSDADYGCAWQGGPAERPLPRGLIREALEFGVNLALYRTGSHSNGHAR